MTPPPEPTELFNFVQVTGDVASSGSVPAQTFPLIAELGYQTVVDLLPPRHREALPNEEAVVRASGMRYENVPVDFAAPSSADLERFASLMRELEGSRVWVHCAANYRVTTFLALVARSRWGWSDERARSLSTRVWTPNAVWQSFYEEAARAQESQ